MAPTPTPSHPNPLLLLLLLLLAAATASALAQADDAAGDVSSSWRPVAAKRPPQRLLEAFFVGGGGGPEQQRRRELMGRFQICAMCTCCGGPRGVCVPAPCCYAINCNIPNRPFGICSFTPRTCSCLNCHL